MLFIYVFVLISVKFWLKNASKIFFMKKLGLTDSIFPMMFESAQLCVPEADSNKTEKIVYVIATSVLKKV